ncbi:MAG: M10 family metallopeptidase domain-containing protein [Candidatus Binatia bacterium]|nr:M10 family metallopeptidase domain-containing protein [Candidatus Binatia bacterium]
MCILGTAPTACRALRALRSLIVIATLGASITPRGTRATTFVLGEPEELFAAADAVVVGRVEGIESVTNEIGTFTNVTIAVEGAIGAYLGKRIVLAEAGGETSVQQRWVFGAPTYYTGERVLVFVGRTRSGYFRTLYLGMGKFRIVRSRTGQEYAVQNLADGVAWNLQKRRIERSSSRGYRLDLLLERLRTAERKQPRRLTALVGRAMQGTVRRPRFTFSGPAAARWFEADAGTPVTFRIDATGDLAVGPHNSIQAAKDALEAWSEPACSALRFAVEEQVEPAPFARCDGKSQILFNDPFDDITDPVDCIGVLGVGGICGVPGEPRSFAGSPFFPISEGDVVIANGFAACPFWNIPGLAEVLTHEIGHAIGLAHSSDDPGERDRLLADATMYFRAHFDYRGAALREDDRAAVCSLYPEATGASLTFERAALVLDKSDEPARHRLLLQGTFRTHDPAWQILHDAFFFSVRNGAQLLLSAGINPDEWLRNTRNNRFRWRSRTAQGVVAIDLVQRDEHTFEFSVLARTDAIQPSASGSLTVSVTLGEASVTTALQLRPGARSLRYP